MKHGVLILALGLLAGAVGYSCIYFTCTTPVRSLEQSDKPELAWLKKEFNLSDAEFERVSELHSAYLPQCHAMCRRIDAQNAQLEKLLSNPTNVTPEIERALEESSRLRTECQTMMLRHFIEVSQTMPAEQGRRYLAWVKEKAVLSNYLMAGQP